MSLTSPLGLTRHLRRPEMRLDLVPWLNVLSLAWMLTLLNSSFIYSPGVVVDLASGASSPPPPLNLPGVPTGELSGEPTDAELSILPPINQNQSFIFDGKWYTRTNDGKITGLQDALTAKRKSLPNRPAGQPAVLLIEADASTTEQISDTIATMAKAAGFTHTVHAEKAAPGASTPPSPAPPSRPPAAPDGNTSTH